MDEEMDFQDMYDIYGWDVPMPESPSGEWQRVRGEVVAAVCCCNKKVVDELLHHPRVTPRGGAGCGWGRTNAVGCRGWRSARRHRRRW